MPVERILAIALVVVSSALLIRLGPGALRSWRIYAGIGQRRQEDAKGRAPAAPAGISDRLALLAELGYDHIGETRLDLPGGERFAWIMAAEDGDSYAILVGGIGGAPLTGIYSAWADGTWLCTMYPRGRPSDRPGLHVQSVPTTLGDAVAAHRVGFERLRPIHGAPRSVRSMPDMLALDDDYRVRFGGSGLRSVTIRLIIPAILSVGVLALSLVLLVDSFH